jgi:carnitine 3-dehydrogenase
MAKLIVDAKAILARVKDFSRPIRTFECAVPEDWTDFNGHMNEARYLDCFSNGSDSLMQLIGCDENYIKSGKSFFTVETHIQHLDEVRVDDQVFVTTQILKAEGKSLHLYHQLFHENGGQDRDGEQSDDRLLATGEQLLLHVDLDTRHTSHPPGEVVDQMRKYQEYHKELPIPDGVGRAIGQKR